MSSTEIKEISTHDLLIRLKARDVDAFDIFYPRYAKYFYAYVRNRLLSHEEAEELVQDIFLRIIRSIDTYTEEGGNGEGWIWQICRNLVIDYFRARNRQLPQVVISEATPLEEGRTPHGIYEKIELAECLEDAWSTLSPQDKAEIQRGRGERGPVRKSLKMAMERFRVAAEKCRRLIDG